jgi:hypothetical protein
MPMLKMEDWLSLSHYMELIYGFNGHHLNTVYIWMI